MQLQQRKAEAGEGVQAETIGWQAEMNGQGTRKLHSDFQRATDPTDCACAFICLSPTMNS